MIRVKFYNFKKCTDLGKKRIRIYDKEDFFRIVRGGIGDGEEKKPFRDEDSLRFIREIDHAEFVDGDDWYSIVTPFGRTNVTALCGGTRYALTLLDNSRRGVYTDISRFGEYGGDIWGRLADASIDILVAYDTAKINRDFPVLAIKADYMIENYPYGGKEIRVYVERSSIEKVHFDNGKYYMGYWLREFEYEWHKDVGGLIATAERLVKEAGKRYHYPPKDLSLDAFADTLERGYSNAFREMDYPIEKQRLESLGLPEEVYRAELEKLRHTEGYQEYVFMSEKCRVRCFLSEVPDEPHVKYPINLLIRKEPGDKTVMQQVSSVKYPTYSETIMYNDIVKLSQRKDEVFGLVLDTETFAEGADTIKYALWGFRNYDSTVELYDGIRVLEEFLKEVKQPYETGSLYVRYEEYENGEKITREERVDKDDQAVSVED